MRPSLALSIRHVVVRAMMLAKPRPTTIPELKHRQPRRQRHSLRLSRFARDPQEAERQDVVAVMTNWQRTQWARAGYPKSIAKIRGFCAMERRPMMEAAE